MLPVACSRRVSQPFFPKQFRQFRWKLLEIRVFGPLFFAAYNMVELYKQHVPGARYVQGRSGSRHFARC